ncbi:MAG: hypothetical protein JXL20_02830, partial [Deltaproteobacteria bacterium]|nr:hypothetical protein [Deltaproteobacteria bacterium]
LAGLLNPEGILLNLVSRPEIYVHEWASFSTRDYPENREAVSGDEVRIINTDIAYAEPVVDILWSHEDYLKVYTEAGLQVVEKIEPLAADDEPYHWVNENNIAPWAIYALKC